MSAAATNAEQRRAEARSWWAARRGRYNAGLIAAGLVAFAGYAAVVSRFAERLPEAEITFFTTAFQAVGYVIMMGLANLCYQLGPAVEARVEPRDPARYRALAFGLGFWTSVALPFLIPLALLITAVTARR